MFCFVSYFIQEVLIVWFCSLSLQFVDLKICGPGFVYTLIIYLIIGVCFFVKKNIVSSRIYYDYLTKKMDLQNTMEFLNSLNMVYRMQYHGKISLDTDNHGLINHQLKIRY